MAELLDRARQLVTAGPYSIRPAETAAVHAAIYPSRDAVCETCPGELGKAYYAIKRWLDQQDNSSSTSTTLTVSKSTSTARFHSDTTTLFPHGLGIGFSNDNLTDSAARYILKNDPDAAQFFKVLPPAAEDGEADEQPATKPANTPEVVAAPAQAAPSGFDYDKLAKSMIDELERREEAKYAALHTSQPNADDDTDEQPALTASTGGAAEGDAALEAKTDVLGNGVEVTTGKTDTTDGDQDDESPVRLSRMNKAQLVAAYTTEVGSVPAESLTNDELRDAISAKRSATPQA